MRPSESDLPAGRERASWFEDAKLGIFVHWGAYAVPAWAEPTGELGTVETSEWFLHNPYAEWYDNTRRISGSPAARHHDRVWGGRHYDEFLDEWHAEDFDASDLIEMVADSGAGYVIPTAKHHDGIALWDAPGTAGRNTVHRGPRRDLVGEIATAARDRGIRFGAYYSGGLDWHFAPTPPIRSHDEMYATRPRSVEYAKYAFAQVLDLVLRYRPSVLWNDIEWPDAGKGDTEFGLPELFRRYYETVPDGVINDRWGVEHHDFATSEYQSHLDRESGLFENTRGVGLSFGHNAQESEVHGLGNDALIQHFVDVVARGGNLLLNVGPTAQGTIPAFQRHALAYLGAWNREHGAAIFGTRPVPPEIASPTDAPWVRWTMSPTTVYAVIVPEGPEVEIALNPGHVDVMSASLVSGESVSPERIGPTRVRLSLGRTQRPVVVAFRRLSSRN